MRSELSEVVENALKLKAENEHLKETLKEARRLVRSCNTDDRSDMVLTMKLLNSLLFPAA